MRQHEYRITLYRHEPETRFWHRVIRRRKTRARPVFTTVPSRVVLQHAINAPTTLSFVAPDLSAFLARDNPPPTPLLASRRMCEYPCSDAAGTCSTDCPHLRGGKP